MTDLETTTGSGSRGAVSAWPVALAFFAVWSISVVAFADLKLDHDVSYFAASGRILNQGATLYEDWVDFNTTAPSNIGRLSAWIATRLQTPLDLTHKATIFGIAFIGLSVILAVVLPLMRRPGRQRWALAIGIPLILMFATPEMGRREHLFAIGITAWMLLVGLAAVGDRRPLWVEIAAGVCGGFALYLKPHFAIFGPVLALIDLARARWTPRDISIATWTAGGLSIALYSWLVIGHPSFLAVMLPVTRDLYGSLQPGWTTPALDLTSMAAQFVGVALGGLMFLSSGVTRYALAVVRLSVGVVVAASIIYIQQSLGFAYQRLPLDIAMNMIALFLFAWALGDRPREQGHVRLGVVILSGLMLVGALGVQITTVLRYPKRESIARAPLLDALRPPHPSDSILAITTAVHPTAEIMTFIDTRWAGAFVSHFPFAALIQQDGRAGLIRPIAEAKRQRWTPWFRKVVAARFCAELPVRVAVETTAKPVFFQNTNFDLLSWLREDPSFDRCWLQAKLSTTGHTIAFDAYSFLIYRSAPR